MGHRVTHGDPSNPIEMEDRVMAEDNYSTDYKSITVRTIDGSTFNGKVNISPDERVSDIFTKGHRSFIVMVDVSSIDTSGKTRFINTDHVVWVEPDDY
jgi:hypothetical protein